MNILIFITILFALLFISLFFIFRWRRIYKTKTPLFSPSSEQDLFIEIDEFNIRYQVSGSGPKLALIHGIGANLNTWDDLVPYLESHFTVLRFDLPGFGESSKPINLSYNLDTQCERIIKLLKALGFKNCYLCGSSMGGALSLWLAKLHPNNFKKVIALAPATNKKLLPLNPKKLLISSRLTSLAINEQTMRFILNRVVHNQNLINPIYIEKYLRHFADQPESIKTFIGATEVISDPRLPSELSTLKSPVLIYWGEHDKMVPYKYIEELANTLPHSQIIVDPSSGHHSMEDHPKAVFNAIKVFLLS